MTYFDDEEKQEMKTVSIDLSSLGEGSHKVICTSLDSRNDAEVFWEKEVLGNAATLEFDIPIFATYLLKIENI